jgi:hypothetical protein
VIETADKIGKRTEIQRNPTMLRYRPIELVNVTKKYVVDFFCGLGRPINKMVKHSIWQQKNTESVFSSV